MIPSPDAAGYYNTEDAATILCRSTEAVRREIRSGRLPAAEDRVGRRKFYRIQRNDLRDYIDVYSPRLRGRIPSHEGDTRHASEVA